MLHACCRCWCCCACSWPREFEGQRFAKYVDWMRTCSAISVLQLPAISIPCGTTQSGEAMSECDTAVRALRSRQVPVRSMLIVSSAAASGIIMLLGRQLCHSDRDLRVPCRATSARCAC
jgi:hypothetical protein